MEQIYRDQAKKERRKKEQERLYKREILDVALELFSERGFHNVSMQEIAQKAEFGLGTLYKFFGNKENLYRQLVLEKARSCHRLLSVALEQSDDPLLALEAYINGKLSFFRENKAFIRLYLTETQGARFNIKVGLDKELLSLHEDIISKLAKIFEQAFMKGLLIQIASARILAISLNGLTNAIIMEWLDNDAQDAMLDAKKIMRIFLGPLLKEEIFNQLKQKGIWKE